MAERQIVTYLHKRGTILLVFILGCLCLYCCFSFQPQVATSEKETQESPEEYYKVAAGVKNSHCHQMVKAARKLARCPNAEPWIILMLLSTQEPSPSDIPEKESRRSGRKQFRVGIATILIKALPEDTSHAVLYALTYLLNDTTRGVWSERKVFFYIFIRQSSGYGDPLRSVARDCLNDCLGEDYGWDALAWRKCISTRADGRVGKKE
jgi:hypothetical protein